MIRTQGNRAHVDYIEDTKDGPMLERYQFHDAVLPYLPIEDVKQRYATCAIVSNSGELLNSRLGREIDANDAVFRINYAPIETFADHVGTKTTFDVLNHHNAQDLMDPQSPTFLPSPVLPRASMLNPTASNSSTIILFETANSEGWRFHFLPPLLKRFPQSVALLSPDFMVSAAGAWRNISAEVAIKGEACSAMKRRTERAQEQLGSKGGKDGKPTQLKGTCLEP
jgi:hypothetical protein